MRDLSSIIDSNLCATLRAVGHDPDATSFDHDRDFSRRELAAIRAQAWRDYQAFARRERIRRDWQIADTAPDRDPLATLASACKGVDQ